MQKITVHEGNVSFEATVGTDRQALKRSIDAGLKSLKKTHFQSMRHPLTASEHGVRPWPEKLTPDNVASWIFANVSPSHPRDAHDILEAMVFENNA